MKKTISLTRSAIYMIIGQALLLVVICLVVASIFFSRSMTPVYADMNLQICDAAIDVTDKTSLKGLAVRAHEIVKASEDPKGEFYNDREAWLAKFADIQASDTYKSTWKTLSDLRHGLGVAYISYVLLYPEEECMVYVMDTGSVDIWSCGMIDEEERFAAYRGTYGSDFDGYVYVSKEHGVVRLDARPYYSDPATGVNAYIVAVTPLSSVRERVMNFFVQTMLVCLLVTVFICIGVAVMLKKRMVIPLDAITSTAERFVSEYETRCDTHEETHAFDEVDPGEITELNELAASLRSMELEMNSYLRDIDHLATERTRISTELEFASRIQSAVLPAQFPPYPERPEIDLYATMNPAREVGGDFYDFFLTDTNHLCLVMADVSGKGIPAALFMMVAKSLLKNCMRSGSSPAQALKSVNDQLLEGSHNEMFVTVWLALIDLTNGRGLAANAGHEHPVLKKADGPFEMIKYRHDPAIGTVEGISFHEHSFELHRGDFLFVYTDGLPEASDTEDEMFGTARMMETLNAAPPDISSRELLEHVKETVRVFAGNREPFDDLTMLALCHRKDN